MATNFMNFRHGINVGRLPSDPSNPQAGDFYFNTTDNKIKQYNGTSWLEVTDEAELANYLKADGTTPLTGNLNFDGNKGINLLDPTAAQDAATKNYVDTEIANNVVTEFSDADFRIVDNGDATKKAAFEVSAISTATTRTISVPDANVDLADVNTSIQQDGSRAFTADQSMGGFKLTNLASPVAANDAVPKSYVDAVAEGIKPKEAVQVATTGPITLSGPQTIDGYSAIAGDRVLVKDQSSAADNGIYVVAAGAWSRSLDFDSLTPINEIKGAYVAVVNGTLHAGKVFVCTSNPTTLGVDPINFIFFNSSANLVGGDGITVSGNNISVDHDGEGLTFNGSNQLALELDGTTLSKSASGLKVNEISNTEIAANAAIDATKIHDGSVSNTEFGYLDGVTSPIQTQLDDKASVALDNLSSTAVNVDILPGVDNSIDLGSSSLKYAEVHATDVHTVEVNHPDQIVTGRINATITAGNSANVVVYADTVAEAATILYRVKDLTSGNIKTGQLFVAKANLADQFVESGLVDSLFNVTLNAGNYEISLTNNSVASIEYSIYDIKFLV